MMLIVTMSVLIILSLSLPLIKKNLVLISLSLSISFFSLLKCFYFIVFVSNFVHAFSLPYLSPQATAGRQTTVTDIICVITIIDVLSFHSSIANFCTQNFL